MQKARPAKTQPVRANSTHGVLRNLDLAAENPGAFCGEWLGNGKLLKSISPIDGEVLALQADGKPHPFQVSASRFGSRLDVDRLRATLPLSTFVFDILHLDGEDLIDQPFAQRHAALGKVVPEHWRVPRIITGQWWVSFFPGLAIAVTVMGFNLIGDGLQDLLDPTRR